MSTLEKLALDVIRMIDEEDYTSWSRAHDAVIKDALLAYLHEQGAVAAERERCKAVVMYSKVRSAQHEEHGERIGHYRTQMLDWIESGHDPREKA